MVLIVAVVEVEYSLTLKNASLGAHAPKRAFFMRFPSRILPGDDQKIPHSKQADHSECCAAGMAG